jgi:hypothetical protein
VNARRPTLWPRRWSTLATLIVLALAAGGGIAAATIPDGAGVIHACYAGKDGAVAVIDPSGSSGLPTACPAGSTELDFNQTGPPGQTGATGAPGVPSAVYGTGGPAYFHYQDITSREASIHLALPAGSYAVSARAQLSGDFEQQATCWLGSVDSRAPVDHDQAFALVGDDTPNRYGTHSTAGDLVYVPLQLTITLISPGGVTLSCYSNVVPAGNHLAVSGMRIMAI